MDEARLRRFANEGFGSVPGSELRDLVAWSWDFAEATGDARWCAMSRTLERVDRWWSEYDTVDPVLLERIQLDSAGSHQV